MTVRLRIDEAGRSIAFLRHGEAQHKLAAAAAEREGRKCRCDEGDRSGCPYLDPALLDAALTERGREQVRGIGGAVDVVLASTSVRALQTALEAFPASPVIALEELRSRVSGHDHTRRRTMTELRSMFPAVSLPDVEDADSLWTGATESRASIDRRVQRFLELLVARPERRVAVVTHFTVFLALLASNADPRVLGVNDERPSDDPAWLESPGSTMLDPGELRVLSLQRAQ